MKKYESIEVTTTEDKYVETEIGCNKCGKTQEFSGKDIENDWTIAGYQEFNCSFGYGSGYDSQRWSFDLCDDCLTELIKTLKHVPDGFGEDGRYAHHPELMFENWKETGVVDLEFGMTPEEIAENGGSIYADDDEDELEEEE